MMTPHPSFPRPTIAEAIAEVHFTAESFEPGLFGEVASRLGPLFPRMVPEPIATIQSGGAETQITQGLRARYPHVDGSHLVQVTHNALSVHALAPYKGWAAFLSQIEPAWEALTLAVSPASVRRLGLRYVNSIPWKPGGPVSEWIAASDLVPRELLNQQELFVLRFSLAPEPGRRLQIMIADAQFPSPGERHLVLDIDVILEAELGTPWGILRVEFEALHERAWSTFSVSCAPRLLEFLKEGSS